MATAQTFSDLAVMQMRLAQDGFYSGEPDGQIGPASMSALAAYAAEHGLLDHETQTIMNHMAVSAIENRMPITRAVEESAIAAIQGELADPYSAVIDIESVYRVHPTALAVCGTVNAKNLYGAYVGAQYFQTVVMPSITGDVHSVFTITANEGAEAMCIFGTSLAAMVD